MVHWSWRDRRWLWGMVVDQIVRSGSRAPNLHGQAASLTSRTDVEQEFALFCNSSLWKCAISHFSASRYVPLSKTRWREKRWFAINTFKKYEAISTTRWGVYWSSRLLSCNILSRKGLLCTLCQVPCAVMCAKYNGVLRKGCLCAVCWVVSSSRRSTIWGLHTPQGSPFTLFIGYEQYCLANKLQLKLFQTGPLKNKNFPSVLLFVIFFLLPSIPPTLNSLYLFL